MNGFSSILELKYSSTEPTGLLRSIRRSTPTRRMHVQLVRYFEPTVGLPSKVSLDTISKAAGPFRSLKPYASCKRQLRTLRTSSRRTRLRHRRPSLTISTASTILHLPTRFSPITSRNSYTHHLLKGAMNSLLSPSKHLNHSSIYLRIINRISWCRHGTKYRSLDPLTTFQVLQTTRTFWSFILVGPRTATSSFLGTTSMFERILRPVRKTLTTRCGL